MSSGNEALVIGVNVRHHCCDARYGNVRSKKKGSSSLCNPNRVVRLSFRGVTMDPVPVSRRHRSRDVVTSRTAH